MRVSRNPPKRELLLVETDPETKRFELFELTPRSVGRLKFDGPRRWVSEDNLVFYSSTQASAYLEAEDKKRSVSISPGEYRLDVESVQQTSGRISIRLRDGREVVILTR